LRPGGRPLLAGAAVAAVGAALIPLAAHERSKIGTGYIEGLSLTRRAIGVPEDFLTGLVVKFDDTWEQLLEAFVLVLAGAGVWLAWRRARSGALLLGAMTLAAAGVPLVLALAGEDYLNTRNVIVACVPFLLLVAAGYSSARRAVAIGGVVLLAAVGLATTVVVAADSDYQRTDFRGSAEAVGPQHGPRALVVLTLAGELSMEEHFHGLAPMPAAGLPVSEVVITAPRAPKLGGESVGRPRVPPILPAPFRVVERRYAQTFTLVRYRAPQPVVVKLAVLQRAALPIVGAPTVLVQR
jgi:peptidoglycan/LPS O-acetylase OafA/YrhL